MAEQITYYVVEFEEEFNLFRRLVSYPELPTVDVDVAIGQLCTALESSNIRKAIPTVAIEMVRDDWLIEKYGISAWTDNTEEKKIIRSFLVAHGCGKRIQTQGKYWINKIDNKIQLFIDTTPYPSNTIKNNVIFISDVRFPNETNWLHEKWGGWLVHLKKYSVGKERFVHGGDWKDVKYYDKAPNAEEAENDPICENNADYRIELETVIAREQRVNGIKITTDDLIDNTYLNEEIKLCLTKCPFLTIK